MRSLFYRLDDSGEPVACDILDLAVMGDVSRVVSKTEVGGYLVSTVFLGLDHGWEGGPPILWETMVFGTGELDQQQERCAGSREQALAMHERMCERVKMKDAI